MPPAKSPTIPANSPTQLSTFIPTVSSIVAPTNSIQENSGEENIPAEVIRGIRSTAGINSSMIEREFRNRSFVSHKSDRCVASLLPSMGLVDLSKRRMDSNSSTTDILNLRNASEFLSFAVRKLIDSSGSRASDLESVSWRLFGPETRMNPDNGIKFDRFMARIESKVMNTEKAVIGTVELTMIADFYSAKGFVKYGKPNLLVFPDAVKFSFNISYWPFSSTNDRLYLSIDAVSSGSKGIYFNGSRMTIGDGIFEFPLFALKEQSQSEESIDVFFEKRSSNQAIVLFGFPSFLSYLYYDPVASLESNAFSNTAVSPSPTPSFSEPESSNWLSGANIIYASCAAGAIALGAVVIGIVVIRKRSKKNISNGETLQGKQYANFTNL
jgi:hypothetical protein